MCYPKPHYWAVMLFVLKRRRYSDDFGMLYARVWVCVCTVYVAACVGGLLCTTKTPNWNKLAQ